MKKVAKPIVGDDMDVLGSLGKHIARVLSRPRRNVAHVATCSLDKLKRCLRPGDVLLVEGSSIFSGAIKYLTQFCWSHAALYVGPEPLLEHGGDTEPVLVEADINEGIRAMDLSDYASLHTRICRPVGLTQLFANDYQSTRKGPFFIFAKHKTRQYQLHRFSKRFVVP